MVSFNGNSFIIIYSIVRGGVGGGEEIKPGANGPNLFA